MGEPKGGEGGALRATTERVARTLVREYSNQGRAPELIVVRFVTEGLYAVEIHERGGGDPERYFVSSDTPVHRSSEK